MATVSYVRIPCDASEPLETLQLDLSVVGDAGDQLHYFLGKGVDPERFKVEIVPLKRMTNPNSRSSPEACHCGVYAYLFSSKTGSELDKLEPNIRATCLSMACGLHSQRFHGDIYLSRLGYLPQLKNSSIFDHEITFACQTPDLRVDIIKRLNQNSSASEILLPSWLTGAAKNNHEDSGAISILAKAMKSELILDLKGEESSGPQDSCAGGESGCESDIDDNYCGGNEEATQESKNSDGHNFVTKVPLCLECRRPSNNICVRCDGAYFCTSPRPCQAVGWSHQAICNTWALYCSRRNELGTFPFEEWHLPLLTRQHQLSEEPYKEYLLNNLCVLKSDDSSTWWSTEVSGWCGGASESATNINVIRRKSYEEGFALNRSQLPTERPIDDEDVKLAKIKRDCRNLLMLYSWEDYYKLRGIPLKSPVALLLTFPLTLHYALVKYGAVPITVAKMLNRQLRIHVVGIEKELNFIDLFKELGFLLPLDLNIELLFIVREDMLPDTCNSCFKNGQRGLRVDLTSNLSLMVQSGTYNDTIDPNFDCGTGPPDIVMALNAGLFAYESWRSVIAYLAANRGIVGVFTDYNEHSGVNCASLGGGKARESLEINPFRQPHAMPVFSMNLPQFSNGFIYAFNEQVLDA